MIVEDNCPDCNNEVSVYIGQSLFDDILVWHRSYRCSTCGTAIEEDGEDTPDDIREALMKTEGVWSLSLELNSKKPLAYKILREALGLSLSDIKNKKEKRIDEIISGTRMEVQWLKNKLDKAGVKTIVKEK